MIFLSCASKVVLRDSICADFPVRPYKGTKSIVISTVSWMGGKNPFLGWAYVAAAALFVLLGTIGLIRHLVKPRYGAAFPQYLYCRSCCSHLLQTSGRHVITLLEPIEDIFSRDSCSLRYIYRASFCMLHSNPIYPFIYPVEDENC